LGPTGSLLLSVGNLLRLAPAKRRCLPRGEPLGLVELLSQLTILLLHLSNTLLKRSESIEQLLQSEPSSPVHSALHRHGPLLPI
jgi:hypothetical protein